VALTDKCVLLVERELLVRMDIEQILMGAGAHVISAADAESALHAARNQTLNAAILDYSVITAEGAAICEYLTAGGVPFIFETGFPREVAPTSTKIPFVEKPFFVEDLTRAVASAIAQAPNGDSVLTLRQSKVI
jgi:DNA-binding NtrC family response regulator